MKKACTIFLTLLICLSVFVSCNTSKDSYKNNYNTRFDKIFSVENEKLLQKIFNSGVKEGNILETLPPFHIAETSRISAGDGAYTFIYENASLSLYNQYCEALRLSEFAQYTEVSFNGIKYNGSDELKNVFTTFVSSVTQIDIGFHESSLRMYVTATPRVKSALPRREAVSGSSSHQYPILWTQFGLEDINDLENSLGYIIRLADGSFIILDSGEAYDGIEERMYQILKKQAPDPSSIVISAWILTHAHMDHVGGFINFANQYGSDNSISLKQVVYNFPDDNNIEDVCITAQNKVRTAIKKFGNNVEILKPHTGNILYYAGLSINILYTQEDYLAVNSYFGNYNTSSIVTQFVINDGTKILVGSDHPVDGEYEGYTWCEGAIWKWYGSFIESYVVSTFHHGMGGGADATVYKVVKPKIVLWCADQSRIEASKLKDFVFNKYFCDETASERDVLAYFVAGDDIVLLSFNNIVPSAVKYDTMADYLAH